MTELLMYKPFFRYFH